MGELTQTKGNPAVLPDLQTLTERARGASSLSSAVKIEVVERERDGALLSVAFADGATTPLRIKALDVPGGAWLFELGNAGRHDLRPDAPGAAAETRVDGGMCVVSAHHQSLSLNLADGSLELASKGRKALAHFAPDLLVGDAKGSLPLFKHEFASPVDGSRASGFGLSFGLGHQERIYGGGESFGNFVKNGSRVELRNSDSLGVNGPQQYQATPYFWSSKGWGVAMLSAAPSRADIGCSRHDIMTISSGQDGLSLLLQVGGAPAERWHQVRSLAGAPRGVPDWSLGLWLSRCFYQDQSEVEGMLASAEGAKVQVDVVNLDARCWMRADTRTDFVWDESRFEPYQSFVPKLRARGVRVCLWENPYVSSASELYHEGVREGYFALDPAGKPYPLQWVPVGLSGFPQPPDAGLVDFTNPRARTWWKDLHRPFLRAGVSCFKTDFGEEIPADAVFSDGSTGWDLRNAYADLYNLCVTEVLEEELGSEGIVWARSGWFRVGSTPVKWGGDSQTTWRALRASLRGGLSQAVGGALYWSHDVGGFYGPPPAPELFLRWAQVGLWGSHVRLHGTSAREPWLFGEGALRNFRQALSVRRHLLPYFSAVCREAPQTGSAMRPMIMVAPEDPACLNLDDQFMVGGDILVAPFLDAEGGRSLYLPTGSWIDLRSGQEHPGGRFIQVERAAHAPAFARHSSSFQTLFAALPSLYQNDGI